MALVSWLRIRADRKSAANASGPDRPQLPELRLQPMAGCTPGNIDKDGRALKVASGRQLFFNCADLWFAGCPERALASRYLMSVHIQPYAPMAGSFGLLWIGARRFRLPPASYPAPATLHRPFLCWWMHSGTAGDDAN